MNAPMKAEIPPPKPKGAWVQTERAAHEAFAALIARSPLAARIMHTLVARSGDHNAVVISQGALANLVGATRRGTQKALEILARDHWIEIRQIGERATVNAYVINSRVSWTGPRDGIRYALFSAAVIISEQEQDDADVLDDPNMPPLRQLPSLYQGERQLPTGDGLPPPSQPSLVGLEPDLPARNAQLDLERDGLGVNRRG